MRSKMKEDLLAFSHHQPYTTPLAAKLGFWRTLKLGLGFLATWKGYLLAMFFIIVPSSLMSSWLFHTDHSLRFLSEPSELDQVEHGELVSVAVTVRRSEVKVIKSNWIEHQVAPVLDTSSPVYCVLPETAVFGLDQTSMHFTVTGRVSDVQAGTRYEMAGGGSLKLPFLGPTPTTRVLSPEQAVTPGTWIFWVLMLVLAVVVNVFTLTRITRTFRFLVDKEALAYFINQKLKLQSL